MTLIDLKRKVRELTTFINYQKSEIEETRNTIKSTQYDKEMVSGSHKHQDLTDVVIRITEMEKDVEQAQKEYNRLIPLINELEAGYKELNERDKLIYLEYHCKGYSAVKIGIRYGITDRQVRKIIKKIENDLS